MTDLKGVNDASKPSHANNFPQILGHISEYEYIGNIGFWQTIFQILINAIGNHWSDQDSRAPLTMMFHGPTGTGKNHITRMLAHSMFNLGSDSRLVHYYSSGFHFQDHSKVADYINDLQSWIVGNSSLCNEQLFVFDEARRFPKLGSQINCNASVSATPSWRFRPLSRFAFLS